MTVPFQAPPPGPASGLPPGPGPAPRLGRTQRWLIGGAIAAVLWLAAAVLMVGGVVLLVTRGIAPRPGSEGDPFAGFQVAQAVFFAGGILFQLGTGAIVITTILAMQAPPRSGSGR